MRAGRLRHRITIERLTATKDAHGQPTDTWERLTSRKAAIDQAGGSEYIASDAENSRTVVTIRMRYDSITKTITTKDRIVHGGVNYDIVQPPQNMQMKNRDLLFTCEATNGV